MNTSSRAKLVEASKFQQQNRFPEALALYRQVIAADPRNGDALHQFGVALAQCGQVSDGVQAIAAATALQPTNPVMFTNLGNALSALGKHVDAVTCYDRAIALRPDLVAAFRGRGAAMGRLGRLDDALRNAEVAVRLAPAEAHTHNDLGIILERLKRREEALLAFERAAALDPRYVEAPHNAGLVQMALGRQRVALASFDRALALQPDNAAILCNRGNVLLALGQSTEALASFEQAIASRPQDPAAHHGRGLALEAERREREALTSYDRALELAPGSAATHLCRGKLLLRAGQAAGAIESLDRAVLQAPGEFEALYHRAVALTLLERHEEALRSFDRALAIAPASAEAHNSRAVVLGRLARPAEAVAGFLDAVRVQPAYSEALTNAGVALRGLNRPEEARTQFDRALALDPDDAMAAWCKGQIELGAGRFASGWPLYEARLRLPHLKAWQRQFPMPRWTGVESLQGKTLLVHAEQGLGDTLQFARYVPALVAKGAVVVFEVQPALRELFSRPAAGVMVVAYGDALPSCDFYCSLLSLPLAFGTDLGSIPATIPYLDLDPVVVEQWRARLAELPGSKIGLNWQGNADTEKLPWIRGRSFPLAAAGALAGVPGVQLISLQKGAAAAQASTVGFAAAIRLLTDPDSLTPADFVASAALMKNLDLVITSDTSVAHLAGALGVPVWIVLHLGADWRWLADRSDSPWYPTARLFRQSVAGEWEPVFERIASELASTFPATAVTVDRP